jgi:hypothetical protein
MTKPVTYPAPLIEPYALERHIIDFLDCNPSGVRNTDVGKAIGYNDSRQWFSYGLLEKLIQRGKVRKENRLYYSVR